MRDHLENVITTHRPGEVNDRRARAGIMHLLSIRQYQSFPGRDGPDHRHVMLLAATGNSGRARLERLRVGKSKTPPDASFRVGDAFPAGYGREVNCIQGAVGTATAMRELVARAAGRGSGGRHCQDFIVRRFFGEGGKTKKLTKACGLCYCFDKRCYAA